MNGLDLDDLPRRLAELADAAGPWDDPMPEILRRAAETAAADADSGLDPDPPAVRARPAAVRAKDRWYRSLDPFTITSIAAVVLLVVGLGWLIHSGTVAGSSSKSAMGDADVSQSNSGSSAAAAAGTSASAAAAPGTATRQRSAPVTAPVPAPLPGARCGFPAASGALSLTAPTVVRSGTVLSVHVRLAGLLAGSVQTREIFAVSDGRVVGRLVPTGKVGPGSAPQSVAAVVTGTLRTSTCSQLTRKPGPTNPQTLPGTALAPGRYHLVVVVTSARAITVSAPVAVTVTR